MGVKIFSYKNAYKDFKTDYVVYAHVYVRMCVS